MDDAELVEEIDKLRRTLRSCDTQASAISWMAKAHELLGIAATKIEKPKTTIYMPAAPYIEIVQSMPLIPVYVANSARKFWDNPAPFDPKAVASTKRTAWTRADTMNLMKAKA